MARKGSKHRSAAEIAAEHEEKARQARIRGARKELKDDPEVAAVEKELKALQVEVIKFDRWKREGGEKAESFRARADLWEARAAEAEHSAGVIKDEMAALRDKRDALIAQKVDSLSI